MWIQLLVKSMFCHCHCQSLCEFKRSVVINGLSDKIRGSPSGVNQMTLNCEPFAQRQWSNQVSIDIHPFSTLPLGMNRLPLRLKIPTDIHSSSSCVGAKIVKESCTVVSPET